MPQRLSDAIRAAVLTDIRAARQDGRSAGQIARDHGVARSTVTKIAKDEGITDAFERAQVLKAARAKQADNAAVRAELISRYYAIAGRLLDRVESPHTVAIGTAAGVELVTVKLPPLRDAQAGMSASAIAVDKALRLEDRNGDGRVDAARSLLGSLFENLQRAHGDRPDGSG